MHHQPLWMYRKDLQIVFKTYARSLSWKTIVFRIKFIKVYIIHCLLPIGSALKKISYSGSIYYVTCILVLRNLLCNHSLSNSFPSFLVERGFSVFSSWWRWRLKSSRNTSGSKHNFHCWKAVQLVSRSWTHDKKPFAGERECQVTGRRNRRTRVKFCQSRPLWIRQLK